MWEKCAMGECTCRIRAGGITDGDYYNNGQIYFVKTRLPADLHDWRIPTKYELKTLSYAAFLCNIFSENYD